MPLAGPSAGIPANAAGAALVNPSGDQWRYRWHNGHWWYWTPENRWVYRNGNQWTSYPPALPVPPALLVAPDPSYASQPAYGNYAPNPYGYYSSPYGYSTGYGGYYNYSPGYQGGYYAPGPYYARPGISIGTGRGGGIRIGF